MNQASRRARLQIIAILICPDRLVFSPFGTFYL